MTVTRLEGLAQEIIIIQTAAETATCRGWGGQTRTFVRHARYSALNRVMNGVKSRWKWRDIAFINSVNLLEEHDMDPNEEEEEANQAEPGCPLVREDPKDAVGGHDEEADIPQRHLQSASEFHETALKQL